ncbi:MAG TPA: four helix bundle protein [Terriglobales bacterium]
MAGTLEKAEILKLRTKQFAIRIVRLCRALPRSQEGKVLSNQLLRSGTSVAANYRAVCRSRSRADFISKMAIVTEEIDETIFWLELLVETNVFPEHRLKSLLREGNELRAIFGASQRTAKARAG